MKKLLAGLMLAVALLVTGPLQAYWYDQVTQYQTVLDYGDRTDGQPVYVGYAAVGVTEDQYKWVIAKFIYNEDDRLTKTIFANGNSNPSKSWDSRATYTYSTD
jgi:hypothetical protein